MQRYAMRLIALVFFLSLSNLASASDLRVGFIERPPYIYTNADGSIRGRFGQQLERILFESGVNANLRRFMAKDLEHFFGHDQLDAFIATKTLVSQPDEYHFTREPLVVLRFYAYFLKNAKPVNKITDLGNTTIILPLPPDRLRGELKNWIAEPDNNIKVVGHSLPFEQQIKMLNSGEANYVITHIDKNTQAMNFSTSLNTDHLQVNDIFSLPMYLIIRKSVNGSENMIQRINHQLRRSR